jgi:branched-chain amino acid aminotransferase
MYLQCLSVQMVVRVCPFSAGAHSPLHHLSTYPSALDVITPPLDGTILPGVTRASVLSLLSHAPHTTALPQLPADVRLHTAERPLTMTELFAAAEAGTLREVFCVGTAAVVIPAARIGWQRRVGDDGPDAEMHIQDIVLPVVGGEGSLAQALWERLVDIQEGRVEWEGWGVPCDDAVA